VGLVLAGSLCGAGYNRALVWGWFQQGSCVGLVSTGLLCGAGLHRDFMWDLEQGSCVGWL
jgi:hypothetical protein